FLNLTNGRFGSLAYPLVTRGVGFSYDGSHVTVLEIPQTLGRVWLIPTIGGEPQLFLPSGFGLGWSADRNRLAYHPPEPGDPIYVADRNGRNPKKILDDKPGMHNHFPTWSPDGRFVYFVHGPAQSNDTDIWRVHSTGGPRERLTFLRSKVAYPTPIDDHTLLF